MSTGPSVTIGLPVYNGERHLPAALASLLAQDHGDLELLVADNASTDRTRALAEEAAARDRRVRVLPSDVNRGANWNYNRVLDEARGRCFMWAAYDDVWEPGFARVLASRLDGAPDAALAFCRFDTIDDDGRRRAVYPYHEAIPGPDRFETLRAFLREPETRGKACLVYGLFRTERLRQAGGFALWGPGPGADLLVIFRVLSLGSLVVTDELLFHKRQREDELAAAHRLDGVGLLRKLPDAARRLRGLSGYLAAYGRLIDRVPGLGVRERALLRAEVLRRGVSFLRDNAAAGLRTARSRLL